MELAEKKCLACGGGLEPLSSEEARKLAEQTPDWQVGDNSIERLFKFPNFVEAMKFANKITDIAEQEDHHPDLHISWGKVRVELRTHAIGGLSINDFIVAAKINRLIEKSGEPQAV